MDPEHPDSTHPRHDHERTDIRVRIVLIFCGAMVIVGLFIELIVSWGFTYLENHKIPGPPISVLAPPREFPPPPVLQVTPRLDLEQLRALEHSRLTEYAWADRQNNVVRIPVDRAMDIIAQRGLPVTPPAPKSPAKPEGGQNASSPR